MAIPEASDLQAAPAATGPHPFGAAPGPTAAFASSAASSAACESKRSPPQQAPAASPSPSPSPSSSAATASSATVTLNLSRPITLAELQAARLAFARTATAFLSGTSAATLELGFANFVKAQVETPASGSAAAGAGCGVEGLSGDGMGAS